MMHRAIMIMVALAVMASQPSYAGDHAARDPVRLGLVDLSVNAADFDDLADVHVRVMPSGGAAPAVRQSREHTRAHGAEMLRAAIAAFRAIDANTPVIVHVASPFRADARSGALRLDMNELARAYAWLAAEGVTLVAQTFVAADSARQRAAIAEAQSLGLIVLASAGNGPNHNAVPPYPAAYGGVISISTTALGAELSRETERDSYVDFSVAPKRFTAIDYRRDPELQSLQGSSAATASALGILGALGVRWPVATREDALDLLACVATRREAFPGQAWGQGVLVAVTIGERVRGLGTAASPCDQESA